MATLFLRVSFDQSCRGWAGAWGPNQGLPRARMKERKRGGGGQREWGERAEVSDESSRGCVSTGPWEKTLFSPATTSGAEVPAGFPCKFRIIFCTTGLCQTCHGKHDVVEVVARNGRRVCGLTVVPLAAPATHANTYTPHRGVAFSSSEPMICALFSPRLRFVH